MKERQPQEIYKDPAYWDGHTIRDGHSATNMHRLSSYDKSKNPIKLMTNEIRERRHNRLAYEALKEFSALGAVPLRVYSQGETFDPNANQPGSIISFTDETFYPKQFFLQEQYTVQKNLGIILELNGEFDLHRVVYGLVNYEYLGTAGVPKIFAGPVTIGEVNHGDYNVNRITSLKLMKMGSAIEEPEKVKVQQRLNRLIPAHQQNL